MKRISLQDMRVAEEAATWLLRLEEDPSPACQADFVAWIRLSARHLQEFLLVKAASVELDGADPDCLIDLSALGDKTHPVTALPQTNEWALPQVSAPIYRRRWPLVTGLAALLCLAAIAGLLWIVSPARSGIYTTNVGDQRTVKLADGSVIYLNTRSRLQVAYSAQARELKLLDGEAMFVVGSDPTRPFRVTTDNATIQALGTRFNVYRRPDATTVSVIEGRVTVSGDEHQEAQILAVGEEALVAPAGRIDKQAPQDIERRIAWRNRQLVFRSEPLAQVAAEFNRYNHVQIRIEDAAIGARRMSGVFDADDPQPLVEFLKEEPDVHIEQDAQHILIGKRRQTG